MRRLEDFPDAHLRVFHRPHLPAPAVLRDVYLIGICGKGMGALAELFAEAGYAVRGSDAAAYPPMSTRLAASGIGVIEGYDAGHLDPPPDLTVVGNACVPLHGEAAAARERGLAQASFPEALAHYFLADRRPIVVAGTHGKTTTTGLMTHVLQTAGLDPGFLVGGVMVGDEATSGLGTGPHFVVEGDEYDAAYFDKRPKMLLYRPQVAIVTSLEFDHADIYEDWDDYREAFQQFVALVPNDGGHLILNGDDPHVRQLASFATTRISFYGDDASNDVSARDVRSEEGGQRFTLVAKDVEQQVFLPMGGAYNRLNALSVAAVALGEGVAPETIATALASFGGMVRRQEEKGTPDDVLVVDDFAHHPTAVHATILGVRERWPHRLERGRLVAVFEPRSNSSRRKVFEQRYGESFDDADEVFISAPPLRHNDSADDFLNPAAVVEHIGSRGTAARTFESAASLLPALLESLQPGDLCLVMSNGGFDGLVGKLVSALDLR